MKPFRDHSAVMVNINIVLIPGKAPLWWHELSDFWPLRQPHTHGDNHWTSSYGTLEEPRIAGRNSMGKPGKLELFPGANGILSNSILHGYMVPKNYRELFGFQPRKTDAPYQETRWYVFAMFTNTNTIEICRLTILWSLPILYRDM